MANSENPLEDAVVVPNDRRRLQNELNDAQDALMREVYRLDTTEICIDLTQKQIRKLEEFSFEGLIASIMGTKAGKIDTLRKRCEDLQREYEACSQVLEPLSQQVRELTEQLQAFTASAGSTTPPTDLPATSDALDQLERALEAGESLLSEVVGTQRSCSRIRGQRNVLRAGGPLVSAAVSLYRNKVAEGMTSQLGGAIRYFCSQVNRLPWDPGNQAEQETLNAVARLNALADTPTSRLNPQGDEWVELEVLTRSIISDLAE